MTKFSSRATSAAFLMTALMSTATISGCAQERDPIIRVGSGVVDKKFFVGNLADSSDDPSFYWRNYVVDGSQSQSLVGIGTWSGVDRVRWEITENMLFARKAYQWIEGADDKGLAEGDPNGTVVAAYKIDKHFDIRREYNPSTGEELNVIVENSTDRKWQDREYMRVDWSQNLVETPLWTDMFIGRMFGRIELSPITHYVSDPNHPDAPHFDRDDGYFDVTSKFYIEPTDSSLFPGLPTCVVVGFMTGSATYECDPQEATVRSSFLRIDPEHDFESLEITRAPGDVVGNPAAIDVSGLLIGLAPPGKQGWDPGYGFTDALYHRFAHIHNLWKKSHIQATCQSDADLDVDGTADECHPSVTGYQGSLGSQCDEHAGRCTVPYRDREIRTVTYHVNPEMPAELLDAPEGEGPDGKGASEDVIDSWSQLLEAAVAYAREVECRRTGGERDACHAGLFATEKEMVSYGGWLVDRPLDETPVLTLCHNPVREGDHPSCGEVGYRARLGDIRHNFLAYWPYASRARYGGIGNWGADPLTGEIRGAAAMIMGRSATHAAAFQRDVIQLALGDISIDDLLDGVPADTYASYLEDGAPRAALSQDELERRVAAIDAEHAQAEILPVPIGGDVAHKVHMMAQMEAATGADVGALSASQIEHAAVSEGLSGSLYEAQLLDGQWMTSVAGLSPDTEAVDDVLEAVSPLRSMDPGALRTARERVETMLHAKGICFGDHEAPAMGSSIMQGLAEHFRQKYPDGEYTPTERGELIYRDLWIEAYKGIAVHEVGHSLGMLHNFASSWDTPNYHPGYWQLRTQEGTSTESCYGQPRTGDVEDDTCMGPRYLDPETLDERGMGSESRPGITYFGQSSVMEYASERFGETIGLGQYDLHAMKSLYGRVLETLDDSAHGGMPLDEQMAFAPRMMSQLGEQDRVTRSDGWPLNQKFPKPTHYTELARKMAVFDPARCREATPEEKEAAGWRLVHGKVCAPAPRDHGAWEDFEHANVWDGWDDAEAPYMRTKAGTGLGESKVRWFYRYGATRNSYFHTQASDAGADPYEVTTNAIELFDARYPWTYFRHKNREFFSPSLPMVASSRTFDLLRAYHWNAANRNAFYRSFGEGTFQAISESDDWHRPTLVAETEMFNALARYILSPEPGSYGPWQEQPVDSTRTIFDVDSAEDDFTVGIPGARYVGQEFDSSAEAGGSWNYTHWMKHAGFGVEKIYATMALTDGRPVLFTVSRDNYLDGRAVKINFRSDMPEAVDRLLGGVLAEDWETVGMYVDGTSEAPKMSPLFVTNEEPTRPGDARVLFANVGYKQQLGMLIFAHVYSRMNGDLTLANKLRVWIDGQTGEINIPDAQQARFYDPTSGYTYIARRYGDDVIDGKVVESGIASRMVAHANALLEAAYEVEEDTDGNVVTDAFGTPVLVTDTVGQPLVKDEVRRGELVQYVGLMDAARQIAALVGYGPL